MIKSYEDFKVEDTIQYGSRATSESANKGPLLIKKELNDLYNYVRTKFSEDPLPWDPRETYDVGATVLYNGVIYVANTLITNEEPPSAHWDILDTSELDLNLKYVGIGDTNYVGVYNNGTNNAIQIGSDYEGVISTTKYGFVPYDNGISSVLGTNELKFKSLYTVDADIVNLNATHISSTDLLSGAITATTVKADLFEGKSTSAEYADLAERYNSDMILTPGTIVGIGGSAEITLYNDDLPLAGVISTNPAFKMNDIHNDNELRPFVALKGQVPCKVQGDVRKGQYIIAKNGGYGYGVSELTFELSLKVVGIALENSLNGIVNIKV